MLVNKMVSDFDIYIENKIVEMRGKYDDNISAHVPSLMLSGYTIGWNEENNKNGNDFAL